MKVKYQSAVDAIDAAERCVATIRNADASDYVAALRACREVVAEENLPFVVRERVDRLVLSVLECVLEARKEAQEEARAAFSGCVPVLLRVFGVALCLGACVAFFFTPWQYASVVPLGFALSILGFGAPLKAVVRAFRRR